MHKCSRTRGIFWWTKKKVEIVATVPLAWISDILIVSKNVDRAAPPRQAGSPVLHLARREEFANQDLI